MLAILFHKMESFVYILQGKYFFFKKKTKTTYACPLPQLVPGGVHLVTESGSSSRSLKQGESIKSKAGEGKQASLSQKAGDGWKSQLSKGKRTREQPASYSRSS